MNDLQVISVGVAAPATAGMVGAPLTRIAPFAILRVAALSADALEALRLPRCEAAIDGLIVAEAEMEQERVQVEDALYRAIKRIDIDNVRLRRRVIVLRRDVHNGRPITADAATMEEVRPYLEGKAEAGIAERWMKAQSALRTARSSLKAALPEETQEVLRPGLRRPLAVANFRRGLEFGNPAVLTRLLHEGACPTTPWPSNLERSLLGYVARAAAKTSPFSSFMSMAVVAVRPDASHRIPAAAGEAEVYCLNVNRGIVARLDDAARLEAVQQGALRTRINPTLSHVGEGRFSCLCNRETVLIGRSWSEQRLAQFRLGKPVAAALQAGGHDTWAGWRRRMAEAGVPTAEVEPILAKLIERGVLLTEPLTDAFDPSPIGRLATRWRTSGSARLESLAGRLSGMEASLDKVEQAQGSARIVAIEEIRQAERSLLAALGQGSADELQNPVLETCWHAGITGTLGTDLLAPVGDLQEFLGTQVIVSPFYARLRNTFIEMYGAGGLCDDPLRFLLVASAGLVDRPEFGARAVEDEPDPAPEGVILPVTAFIQVARGPGDQRPLFAVNRVFNGAAWLAARFTMGAGPEQSRLRSELSSWLRTLAGDREPVDVVLAGHSSDLQAHAPLTERALRWPGEQLTLAPERIIDVGALRLRHDAATGLITVADADDRPLSLVYLGATFPSPIWGVRYALSILTQPYLIARPSFGPRQGWRTDQVIFEPRITHGDVVVRRASWWLSTAYVRKHWFDHSPADRLVSVRRDCDRHRIPHQFFAQAYSPERHSLTPGNVLDAGRKPIWIDIRNPFWISVLENLAAKCEWVSLTEAFPGPDELWLQLGGRPHVSELHLEMTVASRSRHAPLLPAARGSDRRPSLVGDHEQP